MSLPQSETPRSETIHVPIVIVGAGPTGLAAANLLGLYGIETLVLERNAALSGYPKAISIDDEGLRICQSLGLSDALLSHIIPDIEAHYLAEKGFLARVAPTSLRNGFPLISTFHQPALESLLLQGLQRFSCINIRFEHSVEALSQDEHRVCLQVRSPIGSLLEISCSYLMACDGGKSTLRRALGISMQPPTFLSSLLPSCSEEKKPAQSTRKRRIDHSQKWLVVDCIDHDDTSRAAIFFCNPARPAVTVPAPENRRRWEFMLLAGEREEDLLHNASALIAKARTFQSKASKKKIQASPPQIARQAVYTFHALVASRFSQGCVFLLGDAAHLMPPFGGQGMNSGLRDVHNLCWKLSLVLSKRASAHILKTYQDERHPHSSEMILFSSLLGRIIMPTNQSAAFLRDRIFQFLNLIPPTRTILTEAKVKPQPRYKRGLFLPALGHNTSAFTGVMMPQPIITTLTSNEVLFDDLLGQRFALLRLHDDPLEAFALLSHGIWQQLETLFVCIQPSQSPTVQRELLANIVAVIDHKGEFNTFFKGRRDLYLLVRPDRFVLSAFTIGQADAAARALQHLFDPQEKRGKTP